MHPWKLQTAQHALKSTRYPGYYSTLAQYFSLDPLSLYLFILYIIMKHPWDRHAPTAPLLDDILFSEMLCMCLYPKEPLHTYHNACFLPVIPIEPPSQSGGPLSLPTAPAWYPFAPCFVIPTFHAFQFGFTYSLNGWLKRVEVFILVQQLHRTIVVSTFYPQLSAWMQ